MISKECQYCLKDKWNRDIFKAGNHGIRIELDNDNNQWWLLAQAINTYPGHKEGFRGIIIHSDIEYEEKIQIKYCPWCGRKL